MAPQPRRSNRPPAPRPPACRARWPAKKSSNTNRSARPVVFLLLILLVAVVFDDLNVRRNTANKASESTPRNEGDSAKPEGTASTSVQPADNATSTMEVVGVKGREDQAQNTVTHPKYSILPKRLFSVIGLESSGTVFVTELIQAAVDPKSVHREGSNPCRGKHPCNEDNEVQVQHFSLPQGGKCAKHPDPPVVDVVLPSQCTRVQRSPTEKADCNALAQSAWGLELQGRPKIYPRRYLLDIVASKTWYQAQGVEQTFVIVVRDRTMSEVARSKYHCTDSVRRAQEEEVGTAIILDAINTFLLPNPQEQVNKTTYKRWVAQEYPSKSKGGRRLRALPSSNGVVVVSYESLVKLGDAYVHMLFDTLGIEANVDVDVKDSNRKYVNVTFMKGN